MIPFGNLDFPKRANKSVIMPCVQCQRESPETSKVDLFMVAWKIMISVAGLGFPKI